MPSPLENSITIVQHDETRAADGSLLPGWKLVKDDLDNLAPQSIARRQADITRQLRANGVAYSPFSEADETARPWNLDLVPMVIEPADWASLSDALEQRAKLKQALLEDIYGSQELLKSGAIPPAMVYSHKGYLRDSVNPNQAMDLPFFSSDVSRSPSGDWYVVDDICQSPEGTGYALENRLVLSRTIPRLFRGSRVLRIANYFKDLQRYISELSASDGRCVILAPGPKHPHYFEFAYLAKYLGYTLVQVGDITIRDNRAFLKTVSGLERVSVIFRFVKDTELDPLAIGQSGVKGITGLFQAVRAGGVKVLNPLGAGVLDNPALNTCLPALCEAVLGEKLKLSGPPTYWLGDESQRKHVLANLTDLLVRNIDSLGQLLDPRLMNAPSLAALQHSIEATPQRYVAQERIDRSLAPGFRGTEKVQRQITLRMFMVKKADNYEAMPGGLCLLDTVQGGRRPAFDSLIGSKDTWVIADGPVMPTTLISAKPVDTSYSIMNGELPSRVAENLFWMGRNAERCENCARLLRAVFQVLQNEDTHPSDGFGSPALNALLRATSHGTGALPGFSGRGGARRLKSPQKELLSLLHDPDRLGTLPSTLNQLQSSASAVRDRISDELLLVLNKLGDISSHLSGNVTPSLFRDDSDVIEEISELLDNTLMALSAFAGLAHENFTHGDGWRFMMLGRRLERVSHTGSIINTMLSRDMEDTLLLESLLKLFDSAMTYRSRYRSQIDVQLVLQLLLLDEYNPRSMAFQLNEIHETLTRLPGRRHVPHADPLARLAISSLSRVRLADTHALLHAKRDSRQNLPKFLAVLEQMPNRMAELLTATFFSHVETSHELSSIKPNVAPNAEP